MQLPKPPAQERIMALLAHLSALAFGMGLALPAVFWGEYRQKSRYVAFHSLQSYSYQTLVFTLWMLVYILAIILLYGVMIVLALLSPDRQMPAEPPAWLAVIIVVVVLGMLGIYFLLPVIAGVACLLGMDFHYPILGGRLAKYIGYDPKNPESPANDHHEERFMASMSHFAVLVMLWGILGPLAIWLVDKNKSFFLRFQSMQAIVYQGIGTLAYFVFMFFYMLLLFGMILTGAWAGDMSSTPIEAILGFSIGLLCCLGLLALLLPTYHILGQWAGLRILQGHDYQYPLLGRWVAARMKPDADSESKL